MERKRRVLSFLVLRVRILCYQCLGELASSKLFCEGRLFSRLTAERASHGFAQCF